MKASNILLFISSSLLIFLQYGAYAGRNFEMPPLLDMDFSGSSSEIKLMLSHNLGTLLGFNLFGIFGFLLLIIFFKRISRNEKA